MKTSSLRNRLIAVFLSICFFLILAIPPANALEASMIEKLKHRIERFDEVDEHLYRGGQPDATSLQLLRDAGFSMIINFRHEEDLIAEEKAAVEALGMKYVSIPWTIFGSFDPSVSGAFFNAVAEETAGPVFFHCRRGSERTGVMAALYKMKTAGWSLKQAQDYLEQYDIKFIWRGFAVSKLKKYSEELKT